MNAVCNWLWQGCVVTLAAGLILRVVPRTSAVARHRLWWVTLALVLFLPFVRLLSTAAPHGSTAAAAGTPAALFPLVLLDGVPPVVLTSAVGLWALWTSVFLARTASALAALLHTKRACSPFPSDREARLPHWNAVRGRGRPARLAVSASVRSAAVLGLRSPVIALAPGALDELDDEDVDRIVIHEWAHVQRRDDVGVLVQLLISAAAGLHPAIWWINRNLQRERELACDDRAVVITGAAKAYAACLTRLASIPACRPSSLLTPAAIRSSELLRIRVTRLIDARGTASGRHSQLIFGVSVPALVAVMVAVSPFELVASRPRPTIGDVILNIRPLPSPGTSRGIQAPEGLRETTPQVRPIATPSVRTAGSSGAVAVPAASGGRPSLLASIVAAPDAGRWELAGTVGTAPLLTADQVASHPLSGGQRAEVLEASSLATSPFRHLLNVPAASVEPVLAADGPVDSPWTSAASAAAGIGRDSRRAAVGTAGFFTKLSKKFATSF